LKEDAEMSAEAWVGLAAFAFCVLGAAGGLSMQLGSIKKAIRTVEEQIKTLFAKWDARPCAEHDVRMVRHEGKLEEHERRIAALERERE
jgi:hypothetical protein